METADEARRGVPPHAPLARGVLDPEDAGQHGLLRDWLQLQATLCLKPQLARALLRRHVDPVEAVRRSGEAPALAPQQLVEAIETLRRVGARALPITAPAYPARIERLEDASPLLLVRGDPLLLSQRAVAIVGSRAATAYGLGVAREAASELASAGVVVVSGLARGIDGAAHRAALEAGGRTLAIQACGPEIIYPREHRRLADRIVRQGAIVTELPPGTPPRGSFFPLRNRLISALVELVLVVEARGRSGSLVTAHHAADQSVEVMAVPGPIGVATSEGPNRLLFDGASWLLEPGDPVRALGIEPSTRRSGEGGEGGEGGEPEDAPSPAARVILRALHHAPQSRDELARHAGIEAGSLQLGLLELELAGSIEEDRDGRLRATRIGTRRHGPRSGAARDERA